MRYVSTAGTAAPVDLSTALQRGLAADGGLFMPESVPRFTEQRWSEIVGGSLAATATALLEPYVEGTIDPGRLAAITADALDFEIPLRKLDDRIWLLELFHGPTLAFKDVGARVLARWLAELRDPDAPPVTVIVATSGDTGGAVADAFFGVEGTRVVVLYPAGQVSDRQERQMATLGGNVAALRVAGTFDDCQRLAKWALGEPELARRHNLTSANSISIGRLLPQMSYYAHAIGQLPRAARESVLFCTPSGNFGNLTAGLLAHGMGLPAAGFAAATNANDVVPAYLASGDYRPRASVRTLANAMDVGAPSNLDRIRSLVDDDLERLRRLVVAGVRDDEAIRTEISDVERRLGVVLDPHTAVGTSVARFEVGRRPDVTAAVVLSTAHAAKFEEVVEPIVGRSVPVPTRLLEALGRPIVAVDLEASSSALRRALEQVAEASGRR